MSGKLIGYALSLAMSVVIGIPTTFAQTPNLGYYAGLSTLYPYKPVYCDDDPTLTLKTACYGSPGEQWQLPKSSPLPTHEKFCVYADASDPGNLMDNWYQWKPRAVPADKQKYYGERVCYFEDRGSPHNINDLPK